MPGQRVLFGTSGHRGSAFDKAFNEWHIPAISQAICLYRKQKEIDGPLFLGTDTTLELIYRFKQRLCYLLLKKHRTRKQCQALVPRFLRAVYQLR
ncbi:MAG TPA: hypothetical protein VLE22_03525 [Bryobacteraceae bacterium]|nr:hypothetical protein [Bryobacteraceae bacterium]